MQKLLTAEESANLEKEFNNCAASEVKKVRQIPVNVLSPATQKIYKHTLKMFKPKNEPLMSSTYLFAVLKKTNGLELYRDYLDTTTHTIAFKIIIKNNPQAKLIRQLARFLDELELTKLLNSTDFDVNVDAPIDHKELAKAYHKNQNGNIDFELTWQAVNASLELETKKETNNDK